MAAPIRSMSRTVLLRKIASSGIAEAASSNASRAASASSIWVQGGVRHALPVGVHGGFDRTKRRFLRSLRPGRCDQVVPAAEANRDVDAHGGVAVENGGHERRAPGDQVGRGHGADPVGGVGGFAELAEKHGRVHVEMEVVAPHGGVEVLVSGIGKVPVVGGDRPLALEHRLRPVAAEDVDVGRHVLQVARVGQQPPQHIGRVEPALRHGRHFQHMDVQVADARMDGPGTLDPLHPGVHHRHHLACVAARVRLPGLNVPELARRAVHRRVEIEGCDVGIILKCLTRLAHGGRIFPVPGVQHPGVALVAVPVPLRQRVDEGLLGRRPIAGERDRGRHRVMANRQGLGDFGFRVPDPGPVVVGGRSRRRSPARPSRRRGPLRPPAGSSRPLPRD